MRTAPRTSRDRRKAWLCALVALVPLSCASLEYVPPDKIKVTDLPVVSYPFAWMDNERILMRIKSGSKTDARGEGRYATFDLVSYNYKTGERHNYGRVGQQICYADGYISHTRADDDDDEVIIAVYGKLGKETTRRVRRGEMSFQRGARGSCRPWSKAPQRPSWVNADTTIWRLWPRLGFIDCRTDFVSPLAKDVRARFYGMTDKVGVELPFSCYSVSGYGSLRYYPFNKAYFAFEFDYRHPWPEGKDRKAYWLYPNGRVEILTFPYSTAIRDTAVPVVGGFLAFSRSYGRNDDYWVYFLTPNSQTRLYRGNALGITSPDGCKVAMLIDPDFMVKARSRKAKTPVSLKVLDFCQSR